jgi:hypothetical protein
MELTIGIVMIIPTAGSYISLSTVRVECDCWAGLVF